jgi:SNF2 family DNA or RNA helicase
MRLPRPGQTKQVLIYPIIAEGTYDERALTVLTAKEVTQDRIIENFTLRT